VSYAIKNFESEINSNRPEMILDDVVFERDDDL